MVLFFLLMKAELENVLTIHIKKDSNICMKIRNPLSDYEERDKVVIDPNDYIEQDESSREPPCHFQLCWEGSKKQSTITVINNDADIKSAIKKDGKKGKNKTKSGNNDCPVRDYTIDDNENFVPILCIECRGLEPIHYYPMGNDFIITSVGGTIFNGDDVDNIIDFTDGDWTDYDTEHDVPVSISNIEFKWDTSI